MTGAAKMEKNMTKLIAALVGGILSINTSFVYAAVPDGSAYDDVLIGNFYERVVTNWILCMSMSSSTALIMARMSTTDSFNETYNSLYETKDCRRFPSLNVIIDKSHDTDAGTFFEGRVLINGRQYKYFLVPDS
jgi:hypothetical protein